MTNLRQSLCADDVIATEELGRRPSRAPDHEAESGALRDLAETLATRPDEVLQRLVEAGMALTRADSVGISLLEPGDGNGVFRWAAATGAWAPYRDGTMPREASPCGEVIARDAVLLMRAPERAFPALLQAQPTIREALLVPFHIEGEPVGTVWAIKHGPDGGFEREDARLLQSLAGFASAAHQLVAALSEARAARRDSEDRLALANDIGEIGHWQLNLTTRSLTTSALCRRNLGRPEDKEIAFEEMVGGPDLVLAPKAAELLTLAIHELATNAVKHGGLLVATGGVRVAWRTFERSDKPWLRLDWTEEGAPERAHAPSTPRRVGFGSELIEARVPYELGGRGKLAIGPRGAVAELEFPLREGDSILETDAPRPPVMYGGVLDMTGEALHLPSTRRR